MHFANQRQNKNNTLFSLVPNTFNGDLNQYKTCSPLKHLKSIRSLLELACMNTGVFRLVFFDTFKSTFTQLVQLFSA